MSGLVNYASSDEGESDSNRAPIKARDANTSTPSQSSIANDSKAELQEVGNGLQQVPKNDAKLIPVLVGPTIPADVSMSQLPEDDEYPVPHSPYSSNRAMLRDLTLPTVPNYDIPPSPPGSPIQSTNAKFKQFLELKKQGTHFNEKLSKSSALKNPSLMQKLMEFAGIDEAGQYSTTLPKNIWNPDGFPDHAYKESLARSQQKVLKKKEDEKVRGQRESVDFVPSTTAGEPRSVTPNLSARSGQRSAAERVMAGLERGRSTSPQVSSQGVKRKTRFES